MKPLKYFIFLVLCFSLTSCLTGPNDSLDNPFDPNSPDFTPRIENLIANPSQSERKIVLVWSDKSSFEDGFIIEKKYDSEESFFPFDTIKSNAFEDQSLLFSVDVQYRVSSFILEKNTPKKKFSLVADSLSFGEITALTAFANNDSIFVRWFSDTLYDSEITLEYKEASSTNWTNIVSINDTEKVFYLVGLDFSVSDSYDFRVTLYLENYKGELEAFDQKVFQYN